MTKDMLLTESILQSAFELAKDTSWSEITLENIANNASMSIEDTNTIIAEKNKIFDLTMKYVNYKIEPQAESFTTEDNQYEKIFSLLMARFDILQTFREGIKNILNDITVDPLPFISELPHFLSTIKFTLELAGVETVGICGKIRIKAFACIYAVTIYSWLSDESPDLNITMASLDKNMRRMEELTKGMVFN